MALHVCAFWCESVYARVVANAVCGRIVFVCVCAGCTRVWVVFYRFIAFFGLAKCTLLAFLCSRSNPKYARRPLRRQQFSLCSYISLQMPCDLANRTIQWSWLRRFCYFVFFARFAADATATATIPIPWPSRCRSFRRKRCGKSNSVVYDCMMEVKASAHSILANARWKTVIVLFRSVRWHICSSGRAHSFSIFVLLFFPFVAYAIIVVWPCVVPQFLHVL